MSTYIDQALAWSKADNHHLITMDDERYPLLLKEIVNPPPRLFVIGDPLLLSYPQLAIVGSRKATPYGLHHAYQFAYQLSKAGLTITSGLAVGIDGKAHRGALSADGKTIAVAGCGLHHVYPETHRTLMHQLLDQGGAMVSEFPLDTPPIAKNFPIRNRIISGLSLGVLVVEAALKSGSLITARYAIEQNREVFAVPGSINHVFTQGCHHLIQKGAKLVEKVDDILEELGGFQKSEKVKASGQQSNKALPDEYRVIFDQIGDVATAVETVMMQSGLTSREVSYMLLRMELDGYIQSVPGGYIKNIKNGIIEYV